MEGRKLNTEIILRPVYVGVIVRDGQDETPFTKLVWQATDAVSGTQRHGDSQNDAIAALLDAGKG